MRIVAAETLPISELVALFNAGFADYAWPMQMSDAGFRDHLHVNDIDLACSRVVIVERPAAFALIGRRGEEGWVGGMATVSVQRRSGLGARALVAALDAARRDGCRRVWLEVIDANHGALALYEKLGFRTERDLVVWSLPARRRRVPAARRADAAEAHAWIAARREAREPWQRSDASLANLGGPLRGWVIEREGAIAAAVVFRETEEQVSAVQVAAVDEAAAADALLAVAGDGRPLRLTNVPVGTVAERALERLGARAVLRQHEMLLRLDGPS